MDNGWTLHVEDFGPIESADVTLSPLTFFVGDNNSGKSYLMALIYGLLQNAARYSTWQNYFECETCVEWMRSAIDRVQKEEVNLYFGEEEYAIFENLLNLILENHQSDILADVFQTDMSAGKIRITFQRAGMENVKIRYEGDILFAVSFLDKIPVAFGRKGDISIGEIHTLIWFTLLTLIRSGASQRSGLDACFLPTARTGFMLSYSALVQDAFSRAYRQTKGTISDLALTMPCVNFLESLAALKEQKANSKYQAVIDMIEHKITRGKVRVSNELPTPSFFYQPENIAKDFPLFVVSDVVKECSPLILALKYQSIGGLFIEEPELSLHPALQQQMARVLVKLANAGLPVVAATHSDTIIQHVDNMIKLSRLPEERKKLLMSRYGFDADDPIPAEKVSMYQFDVQENGRTAVRRLSCGPYGFEVPTFYDPLDNLLNQTRDTEPDAED